MLRAIAFPSSKERDHHKFSIDWHPNDPSKLEGYDLFRADVIGPQKTGLASSGVERLLIAKRHGSFYYLQYTAEHDFTIATIATRLKDITENEAQVLV